MIRALLWGRYCAIVAEFQYNRLADDVTHWGGRVEAVDPHCNPTTDETLWLHRIDCVCGGKSDVHCHNSFWSSLELPVLYWSIYISSFFIHRTFKMRCFSLIRALTEGTYWRTFFSISVSDHLQSCCQAQTWRAEWNEKPARSLSTDISFIQINIFWNKAAKFNLAACSGVTSYPLL